MAKVFLVDDDVDLVEMNRMVLEKKGHEVIAAYTAEEARAAIQGADPDVAVLDVMMEDLTAGFDLARDLHNAYPTMPMLMLTGIREATHTTYNIEPDETWLPVTKFLEKPVTPDKLADEIEATLNEKTE
jgi:two-component system alkaline phosphatase synthesis response regulator PhoP